MPHWSDRTDKGGLYVSGTNCPSTESVKQRLAMRTLLLARDYASIGPGSVRRPIDLDGLCSPAYAM